MSWMWRPEKAAYKEHDGLCSSHWAVWRVTPRKSHSGNVLQISHIRGSVCIRDWSFAHNNTFINQREKVLVICDRPQPVGVCCYLPLSKAFGIILFLYLSFTCVILLIVWDERHLLILKNLAILLLQIVFTLSVYECVTQLYVTAEYWAWSLLMSVFLSLSLQGLKHGGSGHSLPYFPDFVMDLTFYLFTLH